MLSSDSEADAPSQELKDSLPSSGRARDEAPLECGLKKTGGASKQPKGTFSKFARQLPEKKGKAGLGAHLSQKKQKGKWLVCFQRSPWSECVIIAYIDKMLDGYDPCAWNCGSCLTCAFCGTGKGTKRRKR